MSKKNREHLHEVLVGVFVVFLILLLWAWGTLQLLDWRAARYEAALADQQAGYASLLTGESE